MSGSDLVPQRSINKRKVSDAVDDSKTGKAKPKRQKNDEHGKATPREAEEPKDKGKGKAKKPRGTDAEPESVEEPEAEPETEEELGRQRLAQSGRFGVINHVQLPTRPPYDNVFHDVPFGNEDLLEAETEEEQVPVVDCFFQALNAKDATISQSRLNFVKPYIDENAEEWSSLSLVMRLNLIQGLDQFKQLKNPKAKGPSKTAKEYQEKLEYAQGILRNPRNWSAYNKKYKMTLDGSGDTQSDGEDDEGGQDANASGPSTTKPSTKSLKKPREPKRPDAGQGSTTIVAKDPKVVANWKDWRFSPAKEKELVSLLAKEEIVDSYPDREATPPKEHYTCEEYGFLYRWLNAKHTKGTKYGEQSSAMKLMAMAFKQFFTDFWFSDGRTRSLCRTGRSIMKNLRRDDGGSKASYDEVFKTFFPKTKRDVAAVATAAAAQVGSEDEESEDEEEGKGEEGREDMDVDEPVADENDGVEDNDETGGSGGIDTEDASSSESEEQKQSRLRDEKRARLKNGGPEFAEKMRAKKAKAKAEKIVVVESDEGEVEAVEDVGDAGNEEYADGD